MRQEATEISAGNTVMFANTPSNATRTLFFTIRNTGTGEVKLTGANEVEITPSGGTPEGVFVATMPDSIIAPGSSVVFSITFDPAAAASYAATAAIQTDIVAMPSFTFSIEGTGTAVDLTPPTGTININNSAANTNSLIVNLTLTQTDGSGSGVTQMKISNDAGFPGDWMAYSNTFANWSMSPGVDAMRFVYAKFRDAAGNESGSVSDSINYETVRPTVISTTPLNAATNVLRESNITVDFSEAMNSSTITSSSFILYQGATPIPGVVSTLSTTKYQFNPTAYLTPGVVYTGKVFTTVKDLAGNTLSVAHVWSFTVRPDDSYEGSWGNDEWDYPYELWTTSYLNNGVDDPYGYFYNPAYDSYGMLWNEDWYKIFVAAGDDWPHVTASYRLGSTGANISMEIQNEDGDIILNGNGDPATASANDEVSIWWEPNVVSPGEYFYIRIFSSSAYTGRSYDLVWEDCDDCGM